jgi:hypothetical protein
MDKSNGKEGKREAVHNEEVYWSLSPHRGEKNDKATMAIKRYLGKFYLRQAL